MSSVQQTAIWRLWHGTSIVFALWVWDTTFEWADKIDEDRADKSLHRAEAVLQKKDASDTEIRLAEARLKRALIRKSVAQSYMR